MSLQLTGRRKSIVDDVDEDYFKPTSKNGEIQTCVTSRRLLMKIMSFCQNASFLF